ncbi:MAG: PAS/PAC sensor signal transduction histidine [Desulfovibrionaceae bacterium]|nr:MAG: PAS/PAC sensor signal transduction histidine [Desulfovibrionaceae bacterium]
MKRRSDAPQESAPEDLESLRDKLMGLGERSMRKSYYPELRARMEELERFRTLLDNASDLIFVIEADSGRITDINETALRKMGATREQMDGTFLHTLLSPGQEQALAGLLRGEADTLQSSVVFNLPLAGGGRFPAEITTSVLGLDHRSLAVVMARDVTARLESQRELARAWGYLRSIVDAMPSLLVGVNETLQITLMNAHCAAMTGVGAGDVQDVGGTKGKLLSDVLPWLPELPGALLETMKDGNTRTLRRLPGKGPDGTAWYDVTIFPLNQGRHEAVARIDDVSSRVRMEEVLMQTEKMLSVGALAAGMAHEINNPLAGILQGVQSVLRRFSPDLAANRAAAQRAGLDLDVMNAYLDDREIPSMLRSVQESGIRASRIVSNILEFSRRSDMSKAQVQLSQLVDKALELAVNEFDLKKKYDFRHVRITRVDAPDLPSVWCVPTQIEQVILNLLKNAAQAMAAAGTVEPAITVRTGWCDGMACAEVEDNGPGMPESVRERVFEPFFTTKGVGEGTGLGLSVVYYIVVEQHEGRVGVRSAPGEGAAISIRLPMNGQEGPSRRG